MSVNARKCCGSRAGVQCSLKLCRDFCGNLALLECWCPVPASQSTEPACCGNPACQQSWRQTHVFICIKCKLSDSASSIIRNKSISKRKLNPTHEEKKHWRKLVYQLVYIPYYCFLFLCVSGVTVSLPFLLKVTFSYICHFTDETTVNLT